MFLSLIDLIAPFLIVNGLSDFKVIVEPKATVSSSVSPSAETVKSTSSLSAKRFTLKVAPTFASVSFENIYGSEYVEIA